MPGPQVEAWGGLGEPPSPYLSGNVDEEAQTPRNQGDLKRGHGIEAWREGGCESLPGREKG